MVKTSLWLTTLMQDTGGSLLQNANICRPIGDFCDLEPVLRQASEEHCSSNSLTLRAKEPFPASHMQWVPYLPSILKGMFSLVIMGQKTIFIFQQQNDLWAFGFFLPKLFLQILGTKCLLSKILGFACRLPLLTSTQSPFLHFSVKQSLSHPTICWWESTSLSFSTPHPYSKTHLHLCHVLGINDLFLLNLLTLGFKLLIFMKCSNEHSLHPPIPRLNPAQMFPLPSSWWLFLATACLRSTALSLSSGSSWARAVNSNPIITGPCYYGCASWRIIEAPLGWSGLEKRNQFSNLSCWK